MSNLVRDVDLSPLPRLWNLIIILFIMKQIKICLPKRSLFFSSDGINTIIRRAVMGRLRRREIVGREIIING